MSKIDLSSIKNTHRTVAKNKDFDKKIEPIEKQKNNKKIPRARPIEKPDKTSKNDNKNIKLTELERQKKIKLLELYILDFPEELSKYKKINFHKCADWQLVEYKEKFDQCLAASNNLEVIVGASREGLKLYEMIGKTAGLKIDGIHTIGNQKEWEKNVKATALKYMDGSVIQFSEPENKLAFMIVQNTLMLHYLNSQNIPSNEQNNQTQSIDNKPENTEANKPMVSSYKPIGDRGNNQNNEQDSKLHELNTEYNDI